MTRAWLRALRRDPDTTWVLGVHVPLLAVVLALKGRRILTDVGVGLAALDLVRPDVCLYTGAALVWAAAVVSTRDGSAGRRAAKAGLAVWGILLVLVEVLAHNFHLGTGSALDASLVAYFFTNFRDVMIVVFYELLLSLIAVHVGALLLIRFGPRARFWRRWTLPPDPAEPTPPRLGLRTAASGAALVVLAMLPPLSPVDIAVARSAPVHLFLTALSLEDDAALAAIPEPERRIARRAGRAPPKNVALIILESTRDSATSVPADGPPTTPFLASLAARGLVAERAYTVMTHTSKALVGILCGSEPRLRLLVNEALPGGLPMRCIPGLLEEQGWRTAFFQTATRLYEKREDFARNAGFGHFVGEEMLDAERYEKINYFGLEDDAMLPASRAWLESEREKPFFAVYLTLASHHPYGVPAGRPLEPFAADATLNRYLNSVRNADRFLESLFAQYRALGLASNTVFMVVGDHGQGFGEHGRWQHADVPYEEGVRVPLVIADPDREPSRIAGPVSQMDIGPTVLDVLGFDVAAGSFSGRSLLRPLPPERAVRAYCWYDRRCGATMRGSWKVIHHLGWRRDELYDVVADPGERRDLAAEHPEIVEREREELLAWRSAVNARYAGIGRAR